MAKSKSVTSAIKSCTLKIRESDNIDDAIHQVREIWKSLVTAKLKYLGYTGPLKFTMTAVPEKEWRIPGTATKTKSKSSKEKSMLKIKNNNESSKPNGSKSEEEDVPSADKMMAQLAMMMMLKGLGGGGMPGFPGGSHAGHEHGRGILSLHKPLLIEQIKIIGKIVKDPKYKASPSDRKKLAGVNGLLKGLLRRETSGGNEAEK